METNQLLLVTIILIIPTLIGFIGSVIYVKKKNTIINKALLFGSFLMLATLIMIFYLMPYLSRNHFGYNSSLQTLVLITGSVGYMTFFVTFFFHTRKIVKEIKNDRDELDNIGVRK